MNREWKGAAAELDQMRDDRDNDILDAVTALANYERALKAQDVGTQLQLRPDEEHLGRKAKPRLNSADYIGRRKYHITLTTNARASIFDHRTDARPFLQVLLETAAKQRFVLLAYCFMPDHLHVLLSGRDRQSNLLRFVQRYKQVTSYYFKRETGDTPWQQSFHDRVLRSDENRDVVARYIFDNPQTANLHPWSPAYELRGGEFYRRLVVPDGAKAASLHSGVEPGGNP